MSPSDEARRYLGQTEKPGNSGFTNVVFEAEMIEEGWQKGWAWCSVFCKVVFKNCYPEKAAELNKLFSPSTIQTFRNFQNAAYPIGNVPRVNSLVIWQMFKDGKGGITGHAGIVSEVKDTWQFKSIEGNTSQGGSREGFIVAEHERKVLADVKNGLKVLGFVQINGQSTITI